MFHCITLFHQSSEPAIISRNWSNTPSLSRGPGDASEWYWMLIMGNERWAQPFYSAVVQVDVADFHFGRESVGIDGKPMVLGGDIDPAVGQVADGVVGAAVAELELEGPPAKGASEHLVAEADAELSARGPASRAPSLRRNPAVRGCPGRATATRRSGCRASTSWADAAAGMAITSQPRERSIRRMLYLSP